MTMKNIKIGLVSVIIPTHGNRDLTKLIDSINNSTYKNVEIIVVDEGLERSKQRNIGIDRAKGEYYLFLDSDQYIHPWLIEECTHLTQGGIGAFYFDAVYSPEKITTKGLLGKLLNWERGFYNGTMVDVPRFIKANTCPLFDVNMSGPEDSDWDRRIKGFKAMGATPIYHEDRQTLWSYLKKKAYYSKSMEAFAKKYPNDLILKPWYRCFWIFCEHGKWKRLLKSPRYTIALFFLIFIRGIIYHIYRRG